MEGVEVLGKGPGSGIGYDSFSCIAINETFSIVVFFAFLLSFPTRVRSGLTSVLRSDYLDFDYANSRFLALRMKRVSFLSVTVSNSPVLWGPRQFLVSLPARSHAHGTPEGTNVPPVLPSDVLRAGQGRSALQSIRYRHSAGAAASLAGRISRPCKKHDSSL